MNLSGIQASLGFGCNCPTSWECLQETMRTYAWTRGKPQCLNWKKNVFSSLPGSKRAHFWKSVHSLPDFISSFLIGSDSNVTHSLLWQMYFSEEAKSVFLPPAPPSVSPFLTLSLSLSLFSLIKKEEIALAGVAQWIEHGPVNQRVAGLIPSLGHIPGLQARLPVGDMWEATTHWCVSPSLSPSLPVSLKINKIFFKEKILKNQCLLPIMKCISVCSSQPWMNINNSWGT